MAYDLDPILGVGATISKAYTGSVDTTFSLHNNETQTVQITVPSRAVISYFAYSVLDVAHDGGVGAGEYWTVELLRNDQVIKVFTADFVLVHEINGRMVVQETITQPFELNANETITLRFKWFITGGSGIITTRATIGLIGNYL